MSLWDPRNVPPYPPDRSRSAARQLEKLGVTVRTSTRVVHVDDTCVRVVAADGGPEETIPTRYEKIRVVATDQQGSLDRGLTQLWEALEGRDERMVLRRLEELVPEFSPQASLLANLRDRLGAAEPLTLSRTAG